MRSLSEWVQRLGGYELPVLRRTCEELARLHAEEDSITARDLADLVLRDPFLTVRVLRYSQSRRRARQPTEVTTVEHAIMMHGVAVFFRQFGQLAALEDVLGGHPDALSGVLPVASRAHHAAITARNFAALRHDVEHEEVMVSTLLHDLAEMLVWCVEPAVALQMQQMLLNTRGLRSAMAQTAVLGFPLADLQAALAREWQLPKLLQALMDDRHAGNPRVQTVHVAVSIARHAAHGWYDAGLADDFKDAQQLLSLPAEQVQRWIRQSAIQAARAWRQFDVSPAAAWLPMLPGEWPQPTAASPLSRETRQAIYARTLEQLDAAGQRRLDAAAVVALAFHALQTVLGLRCIAYLAVGAGGEMVEPRHMLCVDGRISAGDLKFGLTAKHLFAKLMERPASLWRNAGNRDKITPLLPATLRQKVASGDFFATSIHLRGAPGALIYADTGGALDESRYNAFKEICARLTPALEGATRGT